MLALLAALALLAPTPIQRGADGGLLAFSQAPRGPGNLLGRNKVVGRAPAFVAEPPRGTSTRGCAGG